MSYEDIFKEFVKGVMPYIVPQLCIRCKHYEGTGIYGLIYCKRLGRVIPRIGCTYFEPKETKAEIEKAEVK